MYTRFSKSRDRRALAPDNPANAADDTRARKGFRFKTYYHNLLISDIIEDNRVI